MSGLLFSSLAAEAAFDFASYGTVEAARFQNKYELRR
jgi:hypothetical protein